MCASSCVLKRHWQQLIILCTEHVCSQGVDPVGRESAYKVLCDVLGITSSSGH